MDLNQFFQRGLVDPTVSAQMVTICEFLVAFCSNLLSVEGNGTQCKVCHGRLCLSAFCQKAPLRYRRTVVGAKDHGVPSLDPSLQESTQQLEESVVGAAEN